MSTLQRLQVRGIRNFGVDAEDEQVCANFIAIMFCLKQFFLH